MSKIEQAFAHLGAALIQVSPKDDHIIVGHMRDAHTLLEAALRESRASSAGTVDR